MAASSLEKEALFFIVFFKVLFNVGQFGYVSGPDGLPVLLPIKPAIPPFSPPPSVSPLTPGPGGSPPGPPGCEVR